MAADRELDFIKLKVDWYKTVFPWILAMVVGAVTFAIIYGYANSVIKPALKSDTTSASQQQK